MPRHSTYRTRGTVEPVGSEWSSGQLGMGIAIAILFGVVCFAFGYIIARNDRPLESTGVSVVAASTQPPAAPAPGTGGSAPAASPVPLPAPAKSAGGAPRPDKAAPPSAERRNEESTAAPAPKVTIPTRAPDVVQRPGARPAEIEPLPTPGQTPAMVKTPIDLNRVTTAAAAGGAGDTGPAPITPPGAPSEAAKAPDTTVAANTGVAKPVALSAESLPEMTPEETLALAAKPAAEIKPPTVAKPATDSKPAAPVPVKGPAVEEAAPAKAPTVTRGSFGIQVAAFGGPKRNEQAQESRKRLKSSASLDAEIVMSPDGAYAKVVVTGFSTREAAKAECEKLKSKTGFADAWVIRLP